MQYHFVVSRIIQLLSNNNIWYETFEHEPVRTSEEAANVRSGYTLQQGAKALIVRLKKSSVDKRFAMIVIPGDKKFDINKIKTHFDVKDVRFATEDEVLKITDGVLPGGVPPFGNLFDLDVTVDPSILDNEKIIFNAGDRRFSIGMYSKDYMDIVKPRLVEIV